MNALRHCWLNKTSLNHNTSTPTPTHKFPYLASAPISSSYITHALSHATYILCTHADMHTLWPVLVIFWTVATADKDRNIFLKMRMLKVTQSLISPWVGENKHAHEMCWWGNVWGGTEHDGGDSFPLKVSCVTVLLCLLRICWEFSLICQTQPTTPETVQRLKWFTEKLSPLSHGFHHFPAPSGDYSGRSWVYSFL